MTVTKNDVDIHLTDGTRELIVKGDLSLLPKTGLTLGLKPQTFLVSGNMTLADVLRHCQNWVSDLDRLKSRVKIPNGLYGVLRGKPGRVLESGHVWLSYHNQGDGYWTGRRLREAVLGALPRNNDGSAILVDLETALPLLASGDLLLKGIGNHYKDQLAETLWGNDPFNWKSK